MLYSIKVLLTLQILDFLFSLDYDFELYLYQETLFKNFVSRG